MSISPSASFSTSVLRSTSAQGARFGICSFLNVEINTLAAGDQIDLLVEEAIMEELIDYESYSPNIRRL